MMTITEIVFVILTIAFMVSCAYMITKIWGYQSKLEEQSQKYACSEIDRKAARAIIDHLKQERIREEAQHDEEQAEMQKKLEAKDYYIKKLKVRICEDGHILNKLSLDNAALIAKLEAYEERN